MKIYAEQTHKIFRAMKKNQNKLKKETRIWKILKKNWYIVRDNNKNNFWTKCIFFSHPAKCTSTCKKVKVKDIIVYKAQQIVHTVFASGSDLCPAGRGGALFLDTENNNKRTIFKKN